MIYTHNNQWRSTILIDGTAEAKLADVLFIIILNHKAHYELTG